MRRRPAEQIDERRPAHECGQEAIQQDGEAADEQPPAYGHLPSRIVPEEALPPRQHLGHTPDGDDREDSHERHDETPPTPPRQPEHFLKGDHHPYPGEDESLHQHHTTRQDQVGSKVESRAEIEAGHV